jgi:hypothetical protein
VQLHNCQIKDQSWYPHGVVQLELCDVAITPEVLEMLLSSTSARNLRQLKLRKIRAEHQIGWSTYDYESLSLVLAERVPKIEIHECTRMLYTPFSPTTLGSLSQLTRLHTLRIDLFLYAGLSPHKDINDHTTILPSSLKHLELTSIEPPTLDQACLGSSRNGRHLSPNDIKVWKFLMDPVPAIALETFTLKLIMHSESLKGLTRSWELKEKTLKQLEDAANRLQGRGLAYQVFRRNVGQDEGRRLLIGPGFLAPLPHAPQVTRVVKGNSRRARRQVIPLQ